MSNSLSNFKMAGIYGLGALIIIIGYFIYQAERNDIMLVVGVILAVIIILTELTIRYETRTRR